MSAINSLHGQIKNPKSKVYRRAYIKRRIAGSGLYEASWQEVTKDVIRWGTVKKEVDATTVNTFNFSPLTMTFSNHFGQYNPNSDENSRWYGYGDQQRTLIKIEAGFVYEYMTSDGIWHRQEHPAGPSVWDGTVNWDGSGIWDGTNTAIDGSGVNPSTNVVFYGYIKGDCNVQGTNQVNIPCVPLTECFRQFLMTELVGLSTLGGGSPNSYQFISFLRDYQDANGFYVFRPFFGDSADNWIFDSTFTSYPQLAAVTDATMTVWDAIQKLAIAENQIPFANQLGQFCFVARSFASDISFRFNGPGEFDSEFGLTIKQIKYYGFRFTKYYSQVLVKVSDVLSSLIRSDFRVRGNSSPWTMGERVLEIDNDWIPDQGTADTLAAEVFSDVSSAKREIDFTTSFIPHLDLMCNFTAYYDVSGPSPQSLWDLFNWATNDDVTPPLATDLIFDSSKGDAILLQGDQFKIISLSMNLDSLECEFIGRP